MDSRYIRGLIDRMLRRENEALLEKTKEIIEQNNALIRKLERKGMEPEIYTPFLNCGWKHEVDSTCNHPRNATPECHQFCCPITASGLRELRTKLPIAKLGNAAIMNEQDNALAG